MEDKIRDIGEDNFQQAHMHDSLKDNLEKPLYLGCSSFTCFSTILRLIHLKARNEWINKGFIELLELLQEMLSKGNTLLTRHYEAKKILFPLGLEF